MYYCVVIYGAHSTNAPVMKYNHYTPSKNMSSLMYMLLICSMLCSSVGCTSFNRHLEYAINRYAEPWTAIILREGEPICKATLINRPPNERAALIEGASDVLLTAASCVTEVGRSSGILVSSDYKKFSALFNKDEDFQMEIKFANIIVHQKYGENQLGVWNDIAMVKLENPINFNLTLKLIYGLSDNVWLEDFSNCTIPGLGKHLGNLGYLNRNMIPEDLHPSILNSFHQKYKMDWLDSGEPVIEGVVGSPMLCWKNGNGYLQGILSQGIVNNTVKGSMKQSLQLSNIPYFIASTWVRKAFDIIDTPSIWFNALSDYIETPPNAAEEISLLDIEDEVNSFYLSMPKGFNRQIIIKRPNDSQYVDLWFKATVYNQVEHIYLENYDVEFVIGYMNHSDLYKCVIDCFTWNNNRPCIFMANINRCYFNSKTQLVVNQNLNIRGLGIFMRGKETVTNSSELFSLEIRKQLPKTTGKWNVSISIRNHEKYYCLGLLFSNNESKFNNVNVSKQCFSEMRKLDTGSDVILTAIMDNSIRSSSLDLNSFNSDWHQDILQLSLESPLARDWANSVEYGHTIMPGETVSLRRYNPYSGAYRVHPGSRPLLVHIVGDRELDHCYGVLVNESAITGGLVNQTHYVLTTSACIDMHNDEIYIEIGYHSLNSKAYNWQRKSVQSVYTNGGLDGVALLEFIWPINLDGKVKLAELGYPGIIAEGYDFLHLSYDVPCNSDPLKPLNEIPVKLNSEDAQAERLFYVPNNHSCHRQMSNHGEPLVAYNRDTGEHNLLALSKSFSMQDNTKFVEYYVPIFPYLHWIRETIKEAALAREEEMDIFEGKRQKIGEINGVCE